MVTVTTLKGQALVDAVRIAVRVVLFPICTVMVLAGICISLVGFILGGAGEHISDAGRHAWNSVFR